MRDSVSQNNGIQHQFKGLYLGWFVFGLRGLLMICVGMINCVLISFFRKIKAPFLEAKLFQGLFTCLCSCFILPGLSNHDFFIFIRSVWRTGNLKECNVEIALVPFIRFFLLLFILQ